MRRPAARRMLKANNVRHDRKPAVDLFMSQFMSIVRMNGIHVL